MSELVMVVAWLGIGAFGFAAGAAGVLRTRRRLVVAPVAAQPQTSTSGVLQAA